MMMKSMFTTLAEAMLKALPKLYQDMTMNRFCKLECKEYQSHACC